MKTPSSRFKLPEKPAKGQMKINCAMPVNGGRPKLTTDKRIFTPHIGLDLRT